MFIAVEDTDSMRGNCTTFLATEIIRELSPDYDLIGNPRLVRLNPAVPWKTRGNGSLVMRFGKGMGMKHVIGEIDGKTLYCYDESDYFEYNRKEILSRIRPLVEKYHESDADPGLFITDERPDQSFYFRGLFTIMKVEDVLPELERIGASIFTIGCGRGLIGATCGLAWRPEDYTYELLAYRMPERWGTLREVDAQSIRRMDMTFRTTFNS